MCNQTKVTGRQSYNNQKVLMKMRILDTLITRASWKMIKAYEQELSEHFATVTDSIYVLKEQLLLHLKANHLMQ